MTKIEQQPDGVLGNMGAALASLDAMASLEASRKTTLRNKMRALKDELDAAVAAQQATHDQAVICATC